MWFIEEEKEELGNFKFFSYIKFFFLFAVLSLSPLSIRKKSYMYYYIVLHGLESRMMVENVTPKLGGSL